MIFDLLPRDPDRLATGEVCGIEPPAVSVELGAHRPGGSFSGVSPLALQVGKNCSDTISHGPRLQPTTQNGGIETQLWDAANELRANSRLVRCGLVCRPSPPTGANIRAVASALRYSDALIAGILRRVRTIAMVGASPNWKRPSNFAMKYLQEKGYRVIPVNPRAAAQGVSILGEPACASLDEVPAPVDMVDVFRSRAWKAGAAPPAAPPVTPPQLLAFFPLMEPGARFAASHRLYGGSITQFSRTFQKFDWHCDFVDTDDLAAVEAALDAGAKALFIENLANPGGVVSDLETLGRLTKAAGAVLIVDNTLATPWLCRPMDWGADLPRSSGCPTPA